MKNIIDLFDWNEEEVKTLQEESVDTIFHKVSQIQDHIWDKVWYYFNRWLDRDSPKARLNYWLKKANLTLAELNIWATL